MWLRTWRTLKLFRTLLQYQEAGEWTAEDTEALKSFLRSPAGVKLERGMCAFILDETQRVVEDPPSQHALGVVHGLKTLWVYMKALTTANIAPQVTDTDE